MRSRNVYSWPGDCGWSWSLPQCLLQTAVLGSFQGIQALNPPVPLLADCTDVLVSIRTWEYTIAVIPGCTNSQDGLGPLGALGTTVKTPWHLH